MKRYGKNAERERKYRAVLAGVLMSAAICVCTSGCGAEGSAGETGAEEMPACSTEKAVRDMEAEGAYTYEIRDYIYNEGFRTLTYSGEKFSGRKPWKWQIKSSFIWSDVWGNMGEETRRGTKEKSWQVKNPEWEKEHDKKDGQGRQDQETEAGTEIGRGTERESGGGTGQEGLPAYFRERLFGMDIYPAAAAGVSSGREGEEKTAGWQSYSDYCGGDAPYRTAHEMNRKRFTVQGAKLEKLRELTFAGEEELKGRSVRRFDAEMPLSEVIGQMERDGLTGSGESKEELLSGMPKALAVSLWFDAETGELVKFLYENTAIYSYRLWEDSHSFRVVEIYPEAEPFELPK